MALVSSTLPDAAPATFRSPRGIVALAPGLALCAAVAVSALLLQALEQRLFGRAWLESLVLAILLGTAVRSAWTPPVACRAGVDFGARPVLEFAVMLLGASVSAATLAAVGWGLLVGIVVLVVLAIAMSFAIGRALGLQRRMALLVACGNSICGNSAIAAVAPVIGADGEDVTAAIAFTALLGVATVLGLPILAACLDFSAVKLGILSGLTVYAVPQVLAATAAAGAVAVQTGTLVKLVRVLMLGPVCLVAAVLAERWSRSDPPAAAAPRRRPPSLLRLAPWFIIGFLALAALRSFGVLPEAAIAPAARVSSVLTVTSMAALGLSTDLRSIARAGPRVAAAVTLSLLGLGILSLGLITLLRL